MEVQFRCEKRLESFWLVGLASDCAPHYLDMEYEPERIGWMFLSFKLVKSR